MSTLERRGDVARLERDLDQLLRAAGHDLAEPARTILGFLDLLVRRHGSALPAEAQEYIAFARDAAQRLQAMVDALLELGRIGRGSLPTGPVDLRQILRAVAADLEPRLAASGGTITIGPLPEAIGDPRLWRRLFTALLENALLYRGERPPVVEIAGEGRTIRVADNGIGIDPSFHERVFAPFQRLHARDAIPGIGMGLTIARRIAERHGATLRLESGDRRPGVVFVIELAGRCA